MLEFVFNRNMVKVFLFFDRVDSRSNPYRFFTNVSDQQTKCIAILSYHSVKPSLTAGTLHLPLLKFHFEICKWVL